MTTFSPTIDANSLQASDLLEIGLLRSVRRRDLTDVAFDVLHAAHEAIPFHYIRLMGARIAADARRQTRPGPEGTPNLPHYGRYATASISTLMPGMANAATTVVRAGLASPKNSA